MFVALEGLDACGKDTVGEWLARELRADLFRFPDRTTRYGKIIQQHLDREWDVRRNLWPDVQLDAAVFQAVQLANRLEVAPRILEALRVGRNVVCVRYSQSGVVYGAADGLEWDHMIDVQRALPAPDLNILLEVDYATSCKRRPDRRDRYEQAGLEFFAKLRGGYERLWRDAVGVHLLPGRWEVVDATKPLDEVQATVRRLL